MAGKRLLDAAKLFNAGRSIAKQHFGLRREQWEIYSQTSSLAKAVKTQTDKVTVTAGAAYELTRRFNETGPQWQQRPSDNTDPSAESTGSTWRQAARTGNTPVRPSTNQASGAAPLQAYDAGGVQPDKAGQGIDDGTLSSLRKRELQRMAERQIPEQTADTEPLSGRDEGRDTFNERAQHTSPELSSLPRARLPKEHEEAQENDEHLDNKDIDSEVFTARGHDAETKIEGLPEGASVEGAFHSPRISQMLSQPGSKAKNPYANRQRLPPQPLPEMVAAEKARQSRPAPDAVSSEEPQARDAEPAMAAQDPETAKLAQAIAQDAEVGNAFSLSQHRPFVDVFRSLLHPMPSLPHHQTPPTKCASLACRRRASVACGSTAGLQPAWHLVPWARASDASRAAEATAVSCSARAT